MNELTKERLRRLLQEFKGKKGHDPTQRDLVSAGFTEADIKRAVKDGLATKYQITTGSGQVENRYKLAISRDTWLKSL